jgi:Mg-chelatase subunit ChlD
LIELLQRIFVNPANLWLAGLVSVPVIIYLINRHRYHRRRWAAMEFLLRAMKKSRRRLQLQNLLLLLIRVAVILLLVLAVLRPVLRQAPWSGADAASQNWVLALDTSYSMGYQDGAGSLFEQAKSTLKDMVDQLLKGGDRVALVTMAYDPQVLVGCDRLGSDQQRRILEGVKDVKLTNFPLRLVASLRVLEEASEQFTDTANDPEGVHVVLFTDLQRKDWLVEASGPPSPGEGERLQAAPISSEAREILQGLAKRGSTFSVARLAAEERKVNVAVTDLAVEPEIVARGVPVLIRVVVKNFGDRDVENLDLSLRIDPEPEDDASEAQLGEVVRLPAGEAITRTLPHRFDASGYHSVVAEVRSDGLTTDNRRQLAVRVEDDVEVLLVDGEPAVDPLESEMVFVEAALAPRDDGLGPLASRFTPFQPSTVVPTQLADLDWKQYAAVIAGNVDEFPEASMVALERYVAEGGALVVFLGPRVRPEYYNDRLHRGGQGLLPLRLGEERGSALAPVYLQIADKTHPVAAYFLSHPDQTYLTRPIVPFYFFVQAAQPLPDSSVRVFCRFNDLDSSPAVFDNPFGRGRVLWVTSTADKGWNELPVWQDFVVFVYESIYYLVGFRMRSENLRVGEPFVHIYESEEYAPEVLLKAPPDPGSQLAGIRTFRVPMREIAGDKRFQVQYDDTSVPGVYKLELSRGNLTAEDSVEYFAVNVETEESDLRPLAVEDLEEYFDLKVTTYDARERVRSLEAQAQLLRGREYWTWCLFAVLALLLLETALAQLFARRSR